MKINFHTLFQSLLFEVTLFSFLSTKLLFISLILGSGRIPNTVIVSDNVIDSKSATKRSTQGSKFGP